MKVLLLMWSSAPLPAAVVGHFTHQLQRSGELVFGFPLAPPGPAALWLVDCVDLQRALELAARLPCDAVEVRPVVRPIGEEM